LAVDDIGGRTVIDIRRSVVREAECVRVGIVARPNAIASPAPVVPPITIVSPVSTIVIAVVASIGIATPTVATPTTTILAIGFVGYAE
jgi:hypothetical protein